MLKAKASAEDPYDFSDIPPSCWDARTYLDANGVDEVPDIKYSAQIFEFDLSV